MERHVSALCSEKKRNEQEETKRDMRKYYKEEEERRKTKENKEGKKSYALGALKRWECGFISHSRHELLSVFIYVVLSCADKGLLMGRSPIRGNLRNV